MQTSVNIALSINLTKIGEYMRNNPTAVWKTKKGETHINLNIWVKPEVDEWCNDIAVTIKKQTENEQTVYVGTGKTQSAFDEIERRRALSEGKLTGTSKIEPSEIDKLFAESYQQSDEMPF